jgi:hypothetical protein
MAMTTSSADLWVIGLHMCTLWLIPAVDLALQACVSAAGPRSTVTAPGVRLCETTSRHVHNYHTRSPSSTTLCMSHGVCCAGIGIHC